MRAMLAMNTRDMVYTSLFAAVVAVLGLIPPIYLPLLPVPITAQSLGVMLAGSILGAKRGGLALTLFLLLIAIGMPVLAGGRGGLGMFLSPSGGFLIGFPIAACTIGLLIERMWKHLNLMNALASNIVGGVLVLYMCGVPWLAFTAKMSLLQALLSSAIYIPGDLFKASIASFIAVKIRRYYPLITG